MSRSTSTATNSRLELTLTDADDFDDILASPHCFAHKAAVRARGEYISTHQKPTDSVEKEGENGIIQHGNEKIVWQGR